MTFLNFEEKEQAANNNKGLAEMQKIENAPARLNDWNERASKAIAALSTIQKIESDEEDAAAEAMLARVRATYELIFEERKGITAHLDELKKLLMVPEKTISTDPKVTESEYNRVRNLRNQWAQDKLDKQRAEEEKIKKETAARNEITRLKTVIETNVHDGIITAIANVDSGIADWMNTITLDVYEEKIKRFNIKPQLKKELFDSWLNVVYDTAALSADDFTRFMDQVKAQMTYEKVNEEYVKGVEPIIEAHKQKLPALKLQLEEIEQAKKENAAKAAELEEAKRKAEEEDKKRREDELQKQREEHAAAVEEKAKLEKANTLFDSQVAQQNAAVDLTGTRIKKIATITGPETDTVIIFSKMLYNLFNSPDFVGAIKIDKKTGERKYDDDGRPVYQDWAEQLLDIYANTCDLPIEGLTIKEKVGTTARAK